MGVALAGKRRGDLIECIDSYRSLETLPDVNCSQCSLDNYKCQLQFSAGVAADVFSKFYIHDDRLFDAIGAKDTVRRDALKLMSFASLPDVLCLHLIRRTYDRSTGDMIKNNEPVKFSIELDMTPYWSFWCPEQPQRIKYQLISVVQHIGNADAGRLEVSNRNATHYVGHYVNYSYIATAKSWVYFSDTTVQVVSAKTVLSCQAYMLFYRRKRES